MTELMYGQYYTDVLLGMLIILGITFAIASIGYAVVRRFK